MVFLFILTFAEAGQKTESTLRLPDPLVRNNQLRAADFVFDGFSLHLYLHGDRAKKESTNFTLPTSFLMVFLFIFMCVVCQRF